MKNLLSLASTAQCNVFEAILVGICGILLFLLGVYVGYLLNITE